VAGLPLPTSWRSPPVDASSVSSIRLQHDQQDIQVDRPSSRPQRSLRSRVGSQVDGDEQGNFCVTSPARFDVPGNKNRVSCYDFGDNTD
jgi:hypothetical protein